MENRAGVKAIASGHELKVHVLAEDAHQAGRGSSWGQHPQPAHLSSDSGYQKRQDNYLALGKAAQLERQHHPSNPSPPQHSQVVPGRGGQKQLKN